MNAQPPASKDEIVTVARKVIKMSFNNYWDKLNEYSRKYDKIPVYTTTVILYLGFK